MHSEMLMDWRRRYRGLAVRGRAGCQPAIRQNYILRYGKASAPVKPIGGFPPRYLGGYVGFGFLSLGGSFQEFQ